LCSLSLLGLLWPCPLHRPLANAPGMVAGAESSSTHGPLRLKPRPMRLLLRLPLACFAASGSSLPSSPGVRLIAAAAGCVRTGVTPLSCTASLASPGRPALPDVATRRPTHLHRHGTLIEVACRLVEIQRLCMRGDLLSVFCLLPYLPCAAAARKATHRGSVLRLTRLERLRNTVGHERGLCG
jgi:hypothetical protein